MKGYFLYGAVILLVLVILGELLYLFLFTKKSQANRPQPAKIVTPIKTLPPSIIPTLKNTLVTIEGLRKMNTLDKIEVNAYATVEGKVVEIKQNVQGGGINSNRYTLKDSLETGKGISFFYSDTDLINTKVTVLKGATVTNQIPLSEIRVTDKLRVEWDIDLMADEANALKAYRLFLLTD